MLPVTHGLLFASTYSVHACTVVTPATPATEPGSPASPGSTDGGSDVTTTNTVSGLDVPPGTSLCFYNGQPSLCSGTPPFIPFPPIFDQGSSNLSAAFPVHYPRMPMQQLDSVWCLVK